ncbi:hypothetical protein HG462_003415 [Candidatus Saccharibacteria bacterium]|nr:hypothetical protein [Candidatus Saccharibacteria bacterium]
MKNLNKKTTTDGKKRSVEETLTLELSEVYGRISNRKHQKNTLIALTVILKSFLNGDLYGRDIAKILSKELLWENYDELTKQGISIDINKLMTVFGQEDYSDIYHGSEFVTENAALFIQRGASLDLLFGQFLINDGWKNIEKLIQAGVPVTDLLNKKRMLLYVNDYFDLTVSRVETIMNWFLRHGATKPQIGDWLKSELGKNIPIQLLRDHMINWAEYGIDPSKVYTMPGPNPGDQEGYYKE